MDSEVQQKIDQVAKAMVTKIYEEIQLEEKLAANLRKHQADEKKISSFTLQKFYEQNQDQETDDGKTAAMSSADHEQASSKHQQSVSELEMNTSEGGSPPQKREPV